MLVEKDFAGVLEAINFNLLLTAKYAFTFISLMCENGKMAVCSIAMNTKRLLQCRLIATLSYLRKQDSSYKSKRFMNIFPCAHK